MRQGVTNEVSMDSRNPVIVLCVAGMTAEARGHQEDARALFRQAWESSTDDFERCVAAHFLARHQDNATQTLAWHRAALAHAQQVGDERVQGFFASLYLNLGWAHEQLEQWEEARDAYAHAAESTASLGDDGYGRLVRRGISAAQRRTVTT
jgi:tetratricopeptide (TPR) repeat protein